MKLIEVSHSKCTGCRSCEMVCSLTHEQECSTAKSRIRIVRDEEYGNNVISLCMQCADASCMDSCPGEALHRHPETGAVLVYDELCIGCEACVEACPLGALSLNREKAVVFKCDLCGGDPECVKWCKRGALACTEVDAGAPERESLRTETVKLLSQVSS